ncbi:alpha/beta hydrolase family protein [Rhodoglobus vestalii]|uniref:Alpha/beta hydrolase family protein n=1 Tax=Rhodoglobus vestalii TaxID=193384 RepID=A0A8H2K434_9MICO|nr:alpha/beta hydrolase [Rhodoglobus vestalii]TQO19393.1 alpha/beta hydrolase family protein [Rhodoglobus vestalii]
MSSSRRRTRLFGVTSAALAVSLLLSGCVSWFLPPESSTTSTPTDETVSPGFERFYQQVLEWANCGEALQCATAIAPMDWQNPEGDTIELALVRQPAQGNDRIGSLLVNPGGPGGSGFNFVSDSVDYATGEALQSQFDVVGFDPRGVNRSTSVSCYSDPEELDEYIYGMTPGERGSDEWIAAATEESADFAQRCLDETGALLGFVDTPSAARDLDMLRAALGDTTLNYLGYSYGTLLGQVYAELFPDKTGRLVLDGAVDPAASEFEMTKAQAQGFERALDAFLIDCVGASDCPFSGSTEQARATIGTLLDRLDTSPLASVDGRQLGSATMFTAIILPLYSQENWAYLRQLFTTVMKGDASIAFDLADNYNGRGPEGNYAENQTEAFVAINCLDARQPADSTRMRQQAADLAVAAPIFGPQMSYGDPGCANWPVEPKRERVAIAAPGAADMLVIGTTNDPATPYEWSQTVADNLRNGHLITYNGEGHTAYNKSNACVNSAVEEFLLNGVVPATDPDC